MGRLTRDQIAALGIAFLNHLEEKDLLKTMPKPEMKLHYQNFRAVSLSRTTCFSSVFYILKTEPRLLRLRNGFVIFKGTSDWNNLHESPGWSKNISSGLLNERSRMMNQLRNPTKRAALLNSPYVDITCEPEEYETSPGYFTCNLKDETTTAFKMIVKNKGPQTIYLVKCLFLRNSSALRLTDSVGCTSLENLKENKVMIPPTSQYEISVECKINLGVGFYPADVFFRFHLESARHSFLVLRHLCCFQSNDIVQSLQPTAPFKRRIYSKEDYLKPLYGERIACANNGNQLVSFRKLKEYVIQKEVADAYQRRIFLREQDSLSPGDRRLIDELSAELTFVSYERKFSLLLQLEEKQAKQDIHFYDMEDATLDRFENRFLLQVPGLAERRPSILKGDRIFLIQTKGGNVCGDWKYEGYVHQVMLDAVVLGLNIKFGNIFMKGMKFKVAFTFNRLPVRYQHRAVENLKPVWLSEILFPTTAPQEVIETLPELTMYNRVIMGNEEQRRAVTSIVRGESRVPYVIFGPPGTGKTVTMVEAIMQVVIRSRKRVLVCAPSNSACDLLVGRLLRNVSPGEIKRLHALSRPWRDVPDNVKAVSNYNYTSDDYYYPTAETLENYYVIATTLFTASRLSSANFPLGHFDYIFVDEAGQATEPECMMAVSMLLGERSRLVLAGDPKQLGPVLRSNVAVEYGLEISFLERLMEKQDIYLPGEALGYDNRIITKLLNNYRSHEAILRVPNQCFYDNDLIQAADPMQREQFCSWEHLPKRGFPLIFHGVKGVDQREANSPSYFNPQEASVVYDYLMKVLGTRHNSVKEGQIGIISPYRKQVQKLRKMVSDKRVPERELIKIGSVEEFQGQERNVIIISTVRSNTEHLLDDEKFNLGFLRNPKRFNVAMTRAKSLLIVIGNPEILRLDHYWNQFLNFCIENGGYTGIPYEAQTYLPKDDMVDQLAARMRSLGLINCLENPDNDVSELQAQIDPPGKDEQ